MNPRPISPWLHRFAVLTAVATLGLLGIGGLVTSHNAGMAVPDWPTSYGYNMFALPFQFWTGGIFYEHTHRLWASAVGFMTTILAVWFYGRSARGFVRWLGIVFMVVAALVLVAAPHRRDDAVMFFVVGLLALVASRHGWPASEPSPRWLRWLGIIAFIAVVLQGVLGGLRVTLFKDELGIFHGTLAQMFFVLICALALFTSRWWQFRVHETSGVALKVSPQLRWFAVVTTVLILGQLALGATMRHQKAGLAIPDFPLAYGGLWPATDPDSVMLYNQRRMEATAANPITATQIHLQMVHRVVAALILMGVAVCAWIAVRRLGWRTGIARLAVGWLSLIAVQVILGAATIWSNKAADIATLHVLTGALSLATGSLLCIVSLRNPTRINEAEPVQPGLAAYPAGRLSVIDVRSGGEVLRARQAEQE